MRHTTPMKNNNLSADCEKHSEVVTNAQHFSNANEELVRRIQCAINPGILMLNTDTNYSIVTFISWLGTYSTIFQKKKCPKFIIITLDVLLNFHKSTKCSAFQAVYHARFAQRAAISGIDMTLF